MLSLLATAMRAAVVTCLLCGLAYPLTVTGLAQWLLPFQANGSLETAEDDRVVGSRLIGQQWNGPEWFHGRLSATPEVPYNASSSGGSNLGPTSAVLAKRLTAERRALEALQPELAGRSLPADVLTTSASGLDPDVTPANARLQAVRVARARGVPVEKIEALITSLVTGRSLGLFGEPRVNVLALNLALEQAYPRSPRRPVIPRGRSSPAGFSG